MKLRLPNKLIAAIVAAASPVLFSTLSTATLGAAAVVAFSQQAESADTWAYNSATNTTTHTDDEGNVTTYAGRVYTWMGKNANLHGSEAGAWQYVDDENGTLQNSTIWNISNNDKTNGYGFLAHGDAAATTSTIRFTASGGTKPAAFSFSPFAVTGIIVEKGAEDYVVQGNTSASRSIILGSTSVEGRSDIAENFSLVTTNGSLTLRGKQTISTSAGATFTLQAQNTITVESTADVTFAGAGKTSLASALQVNKKIAIADGATLALQEGATFADGASLSGSGNLVYEGTSAGVNINFAGADISGWTGAFINKSEQAVLLTMTKNNLYVNADINVSEGATGVVNLNLGTGDKFFTGTSRLNNITHHTNYTLQIRQYGDMTVTGKVQTGRLVVGESEADSYTVFTLDGVDAFLRNSNDSQHDYAAQVQGWGSFVLKNGATQTLSGFNGNSHMKFVADGEGSALTINGAVSTLSGLQVVNGGSITIGADVTSKTLTSDEGSFTVNSGKTLTISDKTYINQPLVVNGEGSVSLGGAIYVNVPRTEGDPSVTYSGGTGYEGSGFRTYKAGNYTITSAAERVTIADGTAWYMGDKAVTDSASYSAGTLTLTSDVTDSAIYYVNSNLSYNQTEMDSADAFEVAAGVTFSASGFRLGQPNGRGAAKVILNEGSVLHGLASEESGSGGNTGTGKRQIESLTLKGDAAAEVDHDFGIIQNNHGGSSLNLNGHTLTLKQSTAATETHNFYLSNTAISNGKIVVEKGVIFNSTNNGVGLQTNTLIENHGTIAINTAQNGATDLLVRTEGDGDINLNVNATINNSSVTKSTGTLTIGNNATLTFGTGDGQNNSMASFSQVVLNNGKIYWQSAASSINNLTVGSSNGTLQIFDINASPIVLEGTTTLNGNLTLTNNNWGEKLTIRKLTGTGNFANTSTNASDTLTVTMEEVANYTGTISTTNPKTIINATLGEQVSMSGVNVSGGTISLTSAPALVGSAPAVNTATVQSSGKLNLSGAMTLEHIYMDLGTLNIKSGNIDVTQLMFSKQGSNVGILNVETGATLHITGTQSTAFEGGSGGSFEICNWAANNEINISGTLVSEAGFTMEGNGNPVVNVKNGGLLTMNAGLKAHNRLGGATAHVNIEKGGTLQVADLNDSTNSHIDLQVSDGGTVEGISANTQLNQQININGDDAAINLKATSEKKLVVGSGINNETATLNLIGGGTVRLAAESAMKTVSADANTTAELAQLSAQSVAAGDAVSISGKNGNVTMGGVKLNSSALTKSDTAVGAVTNAAISVGNNSTVSISDVTMTDSDITVAEGATTNLSNAQLKVTAGGHHSTFDGVTVGENVSVDLRSGATMSFLNQATGVNLKDLYIGSGATVNAFIGTPTAEEIAAAQNGTNTQVEAELSVSGTLSTYDSQATLNANLTMKNGSTIAVSGENGLLMGSAVTFEQGGKMNLSDNIINGLNSLTIGEGLTLFSGVDAFNINGAAYDANLTYKASDFFNLSNSDVAVTRPWDFVVKFGDDAALRQGGSGQSIFIWRETPEPATATLSLLALAALAARRKRK